LVRPGHAEAAEFGGQRLALAGKRQDRNGQNPFNAFYRYAKIYAGGNCEKRPLS
jgi:hypothetical protein